MDPPQAPFFLLTAQGYLLRLTVVPGAQRTQVVGLYGDRLKIRLAAPPEKGAANQELIDFLARALDLPKSSLKLTLGARYEHWRAYDGLNFSASPALNVAQPEISHDAFSPKAVLAFSPSADF